MWFLFGEVSSSSGYFGLATLFYCGTPCAFHIIIFFYTFLTLQSIFPLKLMCVRCITIAFFRSTISAAQNGHKFSINGETLFFWHFVILYFHLAIYKSKLDLCLFILTHLLWLCFKRRETINIMYIIIPLYFLS